MCRKVSVAGGALQGCFVILNQTLDSAKPVVSTLDPSLNEKVAGPGATDANRGTVGRAWMWKSCVVH